MTTRHEPRDELIGLCEQIRHLRAEHMRAGVGSSSRRHLEHRLHDAGRQLDRRLDALLADEEDRDAWRRHAHGGSAPERPELRTPAHSGATPSDRPSGRRPWPR
jgi:hypothetical protein